MSNKPPYKVQEMLLRRPKVEANSLLPNGVRWWHWVAYSDPSYYVTHGIATTGQCWEKVEWIQGNSWKTAYWEVDEERLDLLPE